MSRTLFKKLYRDIAHLRGQVIATALVVACGVASFVAMRSTYDSLLATQEEYYTEYRFGEVFAHLTRAPESIKPSLEKIPGLAAVETRIVNEAVLNLPNLREPAQGRILSIPEQETDSLNDIHLVRGRYIAAGKPDEIIVGDAFANANGFHPGDSIDAIINGRWRRLTIVGVGLSPEYIYEIRGGDIFPDNRHFGIIWMSRKAVATAFDMDGAFNDFSATLSPGASSERVLKDIDRIFEQYGGTGAYLRADQISHKFLSNEFEELRTFGTFLPGIFLGVTAFLVHLVLSRLVNTQREQIGLLKAFGYSDLEIGAHFLYLAFAAVALGVVLGIALGFWMGSQMTILYTNYFRFPLVTYEAGWALAIYSVLITFGAAIIGAISAVRKAVMLPPAEAMRPEAPAVYTPGVFERSGLKEYLSPGNRIVVRNLSRQPIKAMLSVFGISIASALLFTGFYFEDAIKQIVEVQFVRATREDTVVTFNSPRPQRARHELASLPGVNKVETFRVVSARVVAGHRYRRIGLMGVENSTTLHRIVNKDGDVVHIPPAGISITTKLAEVLDVSEGEMLTIEVLEGERPVKRIEIAALVDEIVGMNAYMNIRDINRLMNEDDIISGAYLAVDPKFEDDLYARLKRLPGIMGVGLPAATLQSFNDTFAETIGMFTAILVLFAGAIVVGVVYNAARIALSERGRELASLRVLGFTKREIAMILLTEHAVLTLIAIPFGFISGVFICIAMMGVVDNELIRLPLVFSRRTYFLTAVFVILAAIVSGLLVVWRLNKLDLIAVLKTRE